MYVSWIYTRWRDMVCPVLPHNTAFIQKFQCHLSPVLYNKINKMLKILPSPEHNCKKALTSWFKSRNYEEIKNLFQIIK